MTKTVIGIFETDDQAVAAAEALVSGNFKRESIDVAKQESLKGRGDVTDEKNTLDSGIGKFFRDIFPDTEIALRYAAVAQQGAMVVVQADNTEDAVRAADILDACGAINVDERARLLEDSWTRQDRTAGYGNAEVKVFPGVGEYDQTSETPADQQTHIEERFVSTEGVRIRSRIVEKPAGENVRIREEYREVEAKDPDLVEPGNYVKEDES
jgi:hypothetical protein